MSLIIFILIQCVIPAQAGIQTKMQYVQIVWLDPRLRGDDRS